MSEQKLCHTDGEAFAFFRWQTSTYGYVPIYQETRILMLSEWAILQKSARTDESGVEK